MDPQINVVGGGSEALSISVCIAEVVDKPILQSRSMIIDIFWFNELYEYAGR